MVGDLHIFWNSDDLLLMIDFVFLIPSMADDLRLVWTSWRISSIPA